MKWLKQTEQLAFAARIAVEDARPGLFHHVFDPRRHLIKLLLQAFQRRLRQSGAFYFVFDLAAGMGVWAILRPSRHE